MLNFPLRGKEALFKRIHQEDEMDDHTDPYRPKLQNKELFLFEEITEEHYCASPNDVQQNLRDSAYEVLIIHL